ncbi:MAG: GGDEF domain-containing protein [Emergencia timonensis]|uniref:GGDEF domain-containing protein n=1 Tax=Emergencia timonensis TaxID=1776384 RepID=UPI00082D586C|nr:diguanylate cyclase [Emergencia timonensis]
MITASLIIIKDKESRRLWYIGLFAVLFSIYSASENRFNLYMTANPYLMYLINFIVFAAFPLPLLMFFRESVNKNYKKFYNVIIGAGLVNLTVQMALHFGRILDLREMLLATHIVDFGGLIIIICTLLKTPYDVSERKRRTLLSIIPIGLGMCLDLLTHYTHFIESASNSFYTQVGILLFLAMGAGSVIKTVLNSYKENFKNRYYKMMAFQDGLTGLYNRAAFMEEQKQIDRNRKKYQNVICICADVNNLKQINDEDGHLIGDQVLCRVTIACSQEKRWRHVPNELTIECMSIKRQ